MHYVHVSKAQHDIADIIQSMHSFEVNIRICQPKNSEHHFRGLTYPDVNQKKNAPIVLLYDTVSLFLVLFKVFSYF